MDVMENSPKINEEKFGLSVSAVLCGGTWTLEKMQCISVALINRLDAEMTFA